MDRNPKWHYQHAQYDRRKEQGLCIRCGQNPAEKPHVQCVFCSRSEKVRSKKKNRQCKSAAFDPYGRTCTCCNQTFDEVFLTLNHVANDGAAHRKEVGTRNMYIWARQNGYPANLETNCWNCNGAKMVNGNVCPCRKGAAAHA